MRGTDLVSSWTHLKSPLLSSVFKIDRNPPLDLPQGLFGLPLDKDPSKQLVACVGRIRGTLAVFRDKSISRLNPWYRHSWLHELLSLPIMDEYPDTVAPLYELCRVSCLAFMQLVLHPLASNNRMPAQLLPLLRARIKQCEAQKSVLHCQKTVLWACMLALMLAYEHRLTVHDSQLMEEVAAEFTVTLVPVQPERWPEVRNVLTEHLWVRSECDSLGQELWKKVLCLSPVHLVE